MKVKAQARYQRISPRKARQVIDLIRDKGAKEALSLLKHLPQKGARIIEKVVKSAIANATHNYKLKKNNLVISEAYVDQASILRRWQPRARGRAFPIQKRSSHVTVWVSPAKEEG